MFKKSILLILKIILLTFVMAVLFVVGSSVLGPPTSAGVSLPLTEVQFAGIAMVLVSLVDTILMTWLILRSRLYGWRLMILAGVIFFGVKTVMSQIETWYFMSNVTPEVLRGIVGMYLPIAVIFPIIAVPVLGRMKPSTDEISSTRLVMPTGQLILKLAFLALIGYPVLFFGFGYFVAWQNPEVRQFYTGSTQLLPFIPNLINTFSGDPVVYPFEVMRGLMWCALAAGVIKWLRGSAWEAGLLVALLFSLLMNDVHIFPNPLMPRSVSTTHFIETASSNFLWGLLITWLIHRAHRSWADLFGAGKKKAPETLTLKQA
jgi:hypothetical protein